MHVLQLAAIVLQIFSPMQVIVDRSIPPRMSSQEVEKLCHADQDNFNGLPDLLDRFRIGEAVIPAGFENDQNPEALLLLDQIRSRRVPIQTIAAPLSWSQAGVHFAVLHPPENWHPEASDNAHSLVLDIECQGQHLLLTGDLDQLGLSKLASCPQPDSPLGLMLSPHHGGRSAKPSWLYSWARPGSIVVSQRMPAVGTSDALTPLERSGITLLRTWKREAFHFQWRSDRITAEGFLDRENRPYGQPSAHDGNRSDRGYLGA